MRLSIKLALILGVIGLQSVTVGAILLSSYATSEMAHLRHGRELMAGVANQISRHVEDLLRPVANIASVTQGLFRQKVISADDRTPLENYFLEMMDLVPWMSGIYVGSTDGSFVFVKRDSEMVADGYLTKIITAADGARRVELIWRGADFTELARKQDPDDPYDPRKRPWYSRALAQKSRIWTDPYIFYTSRQPGITAAAPLYDEAGNEIGVVGVDLEIAAFSRFLARLQIAEHGRAFVLTRDGDVIAFPELSKITRPHDEQADLLRFARCDELADPVSRAAIDSLNQPLDALSYHETLFTDFSLDGKDYLTAFVPFPSGPWPWIITVQVPADDFLATMKRNRRANIYMAVAIGLLACLIGGLLARGIAGPMAALSRAAGAVKQRRYDSALPSRSLFAEVGATLSAFRDMTAGLQAEERRNAELTEGLHTFSRAVEQSPIAILITDAEGRIEYVNPACVRITGCGTGGTLDAMLESLGARNLRQADYDELGRCMASGCVWRREIDCQFKGGGALLLATAIAPVRSVEGTVTNWVGLAEDITEQRRAQEQLHQAQKMEVVGQLTGGLAHDYNNLLSVILGNLEILDGKLASNGSGNEDALRHIDLALRAGRRSAALTRRLLAFSRRQRLTPVPTDVNEVITGLSDLLRQTLDETIVVRCDLAPGLWHCVIDPSQLESALLNLTINSRDAMPNGGRLTINTANLSLAPEEARAVGPLPPGDYLRITVEDDGAGMPPEVLAHAFDPFFTTKGPGRGTGLGLSSVYGFVRQSGGHVTIESEGGRGTAVRLYLPRGGQDGPTDWPQESDGDSARGAGERVLVVEDDPDVRDTTAGMLKDLGYEVAVCGDGAEALTFLDQQDEVDLLLTDVVLPGELSGFDLAKEVTRRRPGIGVLCMSGYARQSDDAPDHHSLPLLMKPFGRSELGRRVRAALRRQPAAASAR
ncbi:MAG: cache domain-containing protein [Kiloniellales bacterium]